MHWAAELIGVPWAPPEKEQPPKSFSCWGLVRYVFNMQYGVLLPVITVGSIESQESAIRDATHKSGWHIAEGPLQPGDVVLMRGWRDRRRHAGVAIWANDRVGVLHASGSLDAKKRPAGCVVYEPLKSFESEFKEIQLWRQPH